MSAGKYQSPQDPLQWIKAKAVGTIYESVLVVCLGQILT